jgi:membrane-associated phospholipid phosphatase
MRFISFILICFITLPLLGQHQHTYQWKWNKDGYVLGGSAVFWATSLYAKGKADKITAEDLLTLDPQNLPGFDRSATDNYSTSANKISDVFLFSSIALPFLPHISETCREEDFKIVGMAFETFFITDGLTNFTKAFRKRFRPFTYNTELSDEIRLSNGARYSFPSGHTSASASLSFFAAKVYTDLHPDSKWKPLIWGLAITIPAANGYLRYKAGKHFPSDVITGYLLGAGVGLLVPSLHKLEHQDFELDVSAIPSGLNINLTF